MMLLISLDHGFKIFKLELWESMKTAEKKLRNVYKLLIKLQID